MEIQLNKLQPYRTARVMRINCRGSIRRRLMDMGLTVNSKIQCVGKSPMNDPHAYLICGAVIALRNKDCESITVLPCGEQNG